jgi:hypothetical protein
VQVVATYASRTAIVDEALLEGEVAESLLELMPFRARTRARAAAAPRPRWDDDLALEDPAPGTGWPSEVDLRLLAKPPVYRLPREQVGVLGVEGDCLLGWRAGDAILGDLPDPTMGRRSARRLLGYVRPYLGVLLLGLLFTSVYSGARMGRTYLLKPLLDDVLPAAPTDAAASGRASRGRASARRASRRCRRRCAPRAAEATPLRRRPLLGLLFAALLVVAVLPIAHFGQNYFSEYAMGRVLIDLQQQMANQLLALPLARHHEMRRGDALTRTLTDSMVAHGAIRALLGDVLEASSRSS